MTPDQHLDLIAAKCRELLAIAEKRTPSPWPVEYIRRALRFADKNPMAAGLDDDDCYEGLDYAPDGTDAAFIAACAGPAEAGWRSTLAAIDRTKRTISRMRSWTDNEAASVAIRCAQEEQQQIRAAWPVKMLTKTLP